MRTVEQDSEESKRSAAAVASPSEALWGIAEVSAFLKVPEATVRRWRFYGTGPTGVRIGRHVRYEPSDVRAWWAAQKGHADTGRDGPR
jgi:predicted DNA-binding transcriptional regulator AlpA